MTAPTLEDQRVRRRGSRPAALLVAAATALTGVAVVNAAAPAQAVSASSTHGALSYAWQSTVTHQIHVRGYAYDGLHTHDSVILGIVVDNVRLRTVKAHGSSPNYDATHHLVGKHAFETVFAAPPGSNHLHLNVHPIGGGSYRDVDGQYLGHKTPRNERILQIAQRHVGDNYSYGADGPSSFDCSGFTKYVVGHAGSGYLPHNSEAQRHASAVRMIPHSQLRRGDLIFYMSGGNAYHVSIYAGYGKQYSASTPSTGVVHSPIYDSNLEYGTTWH